MSLAHIEDEGNAVARAYNRSDAIEKRRALMQLRGSGARQCERCALRNIRTNLNDRKHGCAANSAPLHLGQQTGVDRPKPRATITACRSGVSRYSGADSRRQPGEAGVVGPHDDS